MQNFTEWKPIHVTKHVQAVLREHTGLNHNELNFFLEYSTITSEVCDNVLQALGIPFTDQWVGQFYQRPYLCEWTPVIWACVKGTVAVRRYNRDNCCSAFCDCPDLQWKEILLPFQQSCEEGWHTIKLGCTYCCTGKVETIHTNVGWKYCDTSTVSWNTSIRRDVHY